MDSRQPRSRIEKIRIDTLRVPPAGKAQRPFREAKGDKIAAEFDINRLRLPGSLPGRRDQLGGRRPAPGLRHPEVRVREGERLDRVRGVPGPDDGRDGPDVPRSEPEHAGDRVRALRSRSDGGLSRGTGHHRDRGRMSG